MGNNPYIAPTDTKYPIVLTKVANGGWVVAQSESRDVHPSTVGAFSNTADMLSALTSRLLALDPETG
jgi:hypothetical protein